MLLAQDIFRCLARQVGVDDLIVCDLSGDFSVRFTIFTVLSTCACEITGVVGTALM